MLPTRMDGELRVEISGYRITVSKAPSPATASPADRLPTVDSCSSFELVDFSSESGAYSSAASLGPYPLQASGPSVALDLGSPSAKAASPPRHQVRSLVSSPSRPSPSGVPEYPLQGPLPFQPAVPSPQFEQQPSSSAVPSGAGALNRVPLPSPLRVPEYPLQGPLRPRAEVSAEFPACPPELVATCRSLRGGLLSAEKRAVRAWTAGCWARAILQGEVEFPEASASTGLSNRHYCVLAAEGLDRPVVVGTFLAYKKIVGQLRRGESVSQAFPSECECRLYFAGAGVPFPLL